MALPDHVRLEVQRILDLAARRLLAEQLDGDPREDDDGEEDA